MASGLKVFKKSLSVFVMVGNCPLLKANSVKMRFNFVNAVKRASSADAGLIGSFGRMPVQIPEK